MLRIKRPGGHAIWRAALPALTAVLVALVVVPAASAAPTPFTDIHSAGPLSDIYIGNDLSCQVRSGGFSSTEFFPNAAGPGDCGTFVVTGSDDNTGSCSDPTSPTTPVAPTPPTTSGHGGAVHDRRARR